MAGNPGWKGQWFPFSSTPPTGGMKMFEVVIGLTVFGVLYLVVIEILEWGERLHFDAE